MLKNLSHANTGTNNTDTNSWVKQPALALSLALLLLTALLLLPSNPLIAEIATTTTNQNSQPQTEAENQNAPTLALLGERELPNQKLLSPAREQYQQAVKLLAAKKISAYKTLRNQLDDYPLAGHLDYLYHRKYISKLNAQSLDAFEQQHQNPVLSNKLKRTWLKNRANQKDWPTLLQHYDPALANTSLKCQYAQALYYNEQADAAMEQAKSLWLSAKSRPKSCDAIFHLLVKNNGVDSDLAWQRFALAFGAREIQLAKYTTRFLDKPQAETAALYLKLYRSPAAIPEQWNNLGKQAPGDLYQAKLQLLKRLARADAKQATDFAVVLGDSHSADTENGQLLGELKTYIITRHALQDYPSLPEVYQRLGSPQDKSSLEWLLRSYIATAQWQRLPGAIAALPEELKQQERWQYWSVRAQSLAGDIDTTIQTAEQAEGSAVKTLAEQLADKASFYGFLSAEQLQQPYGFEPIFYSADKASTTALKHIPAIQRAIEHFMQNEYAMARSEWRQASKSLDKQQLVDAAYLAREFGWHNQAIVSAISTGSWQHYPLRFPNIYKQRFEQQAERYKAPAQWLYATARQESAFASDARSGAGAMGLMQLMPATAKDVARKVGVKYQRSRLYTPDYNITLGSRYLADMHKQFGNRALASAAYNAGPHRVKKWLKNLDQDIPVDAWIETIRFSETRQYVQNIFSFSLIHSLLYDQAADSLASTAGATPFILQHENTVKPYEQQLQQAKLQQLMLSQINSSELINTTAND